MDKPREEFIAVFVGGPEHGVVKKGEEAVFLAVSKEPTPGSDPWSYPVALAWIIHSLLSESNAKNIWRHVSRERWHRPHMLLP